MKAKKVLGLALSAMMAISAVVPWTGLTATAADEPAPVSAAVERKKPGGGHGDKDEWYKIVHKSDDGAFTGYLDSKRFESKEDAEDWAEGLMGDTHEHGVFWWKEDYTFTSYRVKGDTIVLVCSPDKEEPAPDPETYTVTFEVQDGVEGVTLPSYSATVNDGETVTPPDPVYNEEEWNFEGWFYQDGTAFDSSAPVTSDMTLVAKFTEKETEPPVEQNTINKVVIITGENLTEALLNKSMVQITAVYDESDPSNKCTVLFRNGNVSDTFSTSTASTIPADLTTENYEGFYVQFTPKYMPFLTPVPGTEDNFVQETHVAKEGEQNVLYIKLEIKGEEPVEPETWWYNVRFYLNGESKGSQAFTVETSTDTAVVDIASLPAFTDEFEGATYDHDASSADNAIKNDDGTFTISGSDTAMIYAYFTKEETVDPEPTTYTVTFKVEDGVTGPTLSFDTKEVEEGKSVEVPVVTYDDTKWEFNGWFYEDGTQANLFAPITADTALVAMFTEKETPVEPTKWSYTVKYYLDGKSVITSATVDEDGDGYVNVPLDPKDERFENAKFIQTEAYDAVNTSDDGESVTFQLQKDGALINVYYETEDAPAQDKTINLTFVDADDQAKVLGTGAAVLDAGQTVEEFLNMVYPIDSIIEYAGEKYAYTGSYTSTENETAINATLLYRKVTPVAKDKTINLTFVDADDQTKVLGTGAGVVVAGQTVEEFLNMVYPIDSIIEYAGEKYAYTGANSIVEDENSFTATLLYRKAEVVEKDREIQLTFVDIDSNKTLGHGAGVVPAGEASEAWIYNVYNGDVITFENEKYTYTGANTIVENETSITATLYYKKAEVVGEDKEIQLTFVDADDQTKVLGHGAGVVLAGQTVEEWLNEVYPIGDVIEYAGAKYAYTGANAIVEGEDSFTATLLYRKTEALEKDKEIQLTFVDADDQTKVLGHGAGVVLAGQTVEEWLNEVYPIGDVIEYAGAKYVYTGSNTIVENEDGITATLLYRKDTDPTDPDEPDDSDDDDRPSSGGGYFPSRPEEEIDDDTTPGASNPGDGSGSAGPGGAGDGAVAVEDPTDTLGDNDVPRVNAPQTGRKIAGSIALLAGAAAVAVVTLKKRKDK